MGRFLPLREVLTEAARTRAPTAQSVLRAVLRALLRHSPGPPRDDVALLVLRNERYARHPVPPPRPRATSGAPPADHLWCPAWSPAGPGAGRPPASPTE